MCGFFCTALCVEFNPYVVKKCIILSFSLFCVVSCCKNIAQFSYFTVCFLRETEVRGSGGIEGKGEKIILSSLHAQHQQGA